MVEVDLRPCDFDKVWPLVRGRISPTLERMDGGQQAMIEEIRSGSALCWTSQYGLLVIQFRPTLGGGHHLFVRAAVSFDPTQDAVEQHMPALRKMAHDLGANQIRFRSVRLGWLRRLKAPWRVCHIEYAAEV
jgi:hypothetical protein